MSKNSIFNIGRIFSAWRNSMAGLRAAFVTQAAFRQDLILCAGAAVVAAFIPVGATARAIMWASLILIPIAELINTAIEATIDRIGPEIHPLSKTAKDIGSAIVLLTIVAVAVLWLLLIIAAI